MLGWRGASASFALVAAWAVPAVVLAAGPSITARHAVIMDAATGAVLWERGGDQVAPPASTTKVMTAIVALESGRLDESFPVSARASRTPPSKINLRPGQRMRLRNLLYAVLLNSANDASAVVAEGLAGSEAAFAARMNARARELGANSTRFSNPHGLTAPGHVSSARDLAVIFRHGLRMPLFREMLETRSVRVPVESSRVRYVGLRSHNRLLSGHAYPVIGKTGYTRAARRCFVGAASHNNRQLIIAFLSSRDLWGDARRLLAYGFTAIGEQPPVVMAKAGPTVDSIVEPSAEGDDEEPEEVARVTPANFVVQLGPYGTQRTAIAVRKRLANRGYTAVRAGRTLRVGRFSNRNRAQRLASRLRLAGHRSTVVALN
jgi:D-alanyl-D-alanine carboxypeptidase (penicillin-binding protein 5/6)